MSYSHPREKIGRNAFCPCGSGKKYKRCCLESASARTPTPWERQRAASDHLTAELMKFSRKHFGEESFQAWIDFNQTRFPEPLDKHPDDAQIFVPYFWFDWEPELPPVRKRRKPTPGIVIGAFLAEKADELSDLEQLILYENITQPVSFYEVIRCEPGQGMHLRDVLIGHEFDVEEHTGSETLRQGDLIYAQLCRLPDVTTVGRMAPVALPPTYKSDVVRLRAKLKRKIAKKGRALGAEDLRWYRDEIRTVYLDSRDAYRKPPVLCNTDHEPLLFHTLTFRIGSAQVAFDALAPLAWGETKEDLLETAEFDREGVLRSVRFDWRKKGNAMHKTWDNTILGHLNISGRKLTVDVNSAERADSIRDEIERRMGIVVVHEGTQVRTPEEMMDARKGAPRQLASGHEKEIDPEVFEEFQSQMQAEMENWVDERIPILGNRTPREAVADPDGREIVESLLLQLERNSGKSLQPGVFQPDVAAVRRLLSL
jgi:hypothetical protein